MAGEEKRSRKRRTQHGSMRGTSSAKLIMTRKKNQKLHAFQSHTYAIRTLKSERNSQITCNNECVGFSSHSSNLVARMEIWYTSCYRLRLCRCCRLLLQLMIVSKIIEFQPLSSRCGRTIDHAFLLVRFFIPRDRCASIVLN